MYTPCHMTGSAYLGTFLAVFLISTSCPSASAQPIADPVPCWHLACGKDLPPGVNLACGDHPDRSAATLPIVLHQQPEHGPTGCTLTALMDRGSYELAVTYRNPQKATTLQVDIDGYLHTNLETYQYGPEGEPYTNRYPFRIEEPLEHVIRLAIAPIDPHRYVQLAESLTITEITLRRIPPEPTPDPEPGRPYADLWGWMACIDYQRAQPASREALQASTLDEPYKWGANFVQAYPHMWHRDWRRRWSTEDIEAYRKHAHEQRYLIDCHGFPIHDADKFIEQVKTWGRLDSNPLAYGWEPVVDTWEVESPGQAVPDDGDFTIRLLHTLWSFNPGTPYNQCDYRPNTWQHFGTTSDFVSWYRGPNTVKTIMCANFVRVGERHLPTVGYTDKAPFRVFGGDRGLNDGTRRLFMGYQADSRFFSYGGKNAGSLFGGGATADLILKQANDFFRPRALDPTDVSESALWWLGETPEIIPGHHRASVYAASMDPIRCAFSATFAATGFDGSVARRRELFEELAGESVRCPWGLNDIAPLPARTVFIQNNFFRLQRSPDGDAGMLLIDPQRTAHFDNNSLAVEAAAMHDVPKHGRELLVVRNVDTPLTRTFDADVEFVWLRLWPREVTSATWLDVEVDGRCLAKLRLANKREARVPLDLGYVGSHTLTLRPSFGDAPALIEARLIANPLRRPDPVLVLDVGQTENGLPTQLTAGTTPAENDTSARPVSPTDRFEFSFQATEGNYILRMTTASDTSARVRVYRDGYSGTRVEPHVKIESVMKFGTCGELRFDDSRRAATPVDLNYTGKHTIELVATSGSLNPATIEMVPAGVQHRWVERGGHRSVLEETFQTGGDEDARQLTRRYTADNDCPWLRVDVSTQDHAAPHTLQLALGNYDQFVHAGTTETTSGAYEPDFVMRFRDTRGLAPELIMLCPEPYQVDKIVWDPRYGATITTRQSSETLTYYLMPGGVYEEEHLRELAELLAIPVPFVHIPEPHHSIAVRNNYDLPLTRTFVMDDPSSGRYFVQEDGWWHERGTQPSSEVPTHEFLKLRIPAHSTAYVQSEGYIDHIVRPGWGSQYLLAIRDIEPKDDRTACTVRVSSATAYVFAPRLEFANPFTRVTIEGRDWPYRYGRNVLLPTRPGTYRIEVQDTGRDTPHLIAASGRLMNGFWNQERRELHVQIGLQPWTHRIPEALDYFAIVDRAGYTLESIDGAELVDLEPLGLSDEFRAAMAERGLTIRFRPNDPMDPSSGRITMTFAPKPR